jgi:hypothetical protein
VLSLSKHAGLVLTGAVILTAAVAHAGAWTASVQVEPPDRPEQLRSTIEGRFEVIRLSGGVGLIPRDRTAAIRMIEVRDRTVAIDGSVASGQELRQRIGDGADAILQLTYLSPDALLSLFDVEPVTSVGTASVPEQPQVEPDPNLDRERVRRTRRTTRADVFRLGGPVTIGVDEIVRGDVVLIGGALSVEGEVTGDIVVIGGAVTFGPEAEVRGDVTIIGGAVHRSPTAQLRGGVNEIGVGDMDFNLPRLGWPWGRWRLWRLGQVLDLGGTIVRLVFAGLLGSLILLAARGSVDRIALRAAQEPIKAGFVGFLTQLLFVPALIIGILILVISIVGILLLPLIPLVLIAALVVMLVGFTGVAQGVGHWAASRLGRSAMSPYVCLWIGVVLLVATTLVGEILDLTGVFGFMSTAFAITGFFIEYAAWTTGLGAVILNRFSPVSSAMPAAAPVGAPASPPPPPLPEVQ